jgi:hypothetical protein
VGAGFVAAHPSAKGAKEWGTLFVVNLKSYFLINYYQIKSYCLVHTFSY